MRSLVVCLSALVCFAVSSNPCLGQCFRFKPTAPYQEGCDIETQGCVPVDPLPAVGKPCGAGPIQNQITRASSATWDSVVHGQGSGYNLESTTTIVCARSAPCISQVGVFGVPFCGADLNNVKDLTKTKYVINTDSACDKDS